MKPPLHGIDWLGTSLLGEAMKFAFTVFGSVIVAVLLASCSSYPSAARSLSRAQLDDFKNALIAYIDSHPGFFIGRASSEGLKNKQFMVLESPEPVRRYSLEEFIIIPSKMRFQANYGVHGPEPYSYDGEFTNSASGTLQVGAVKLTRFHIRPQPTD